MQPNKTGPYVEAMVLQDINWDFKFDMKELYGPNQFPVSVKRGKGAIDGSAKFARIRSAVIAAVFNQTPAATGVLKVSDSAADASPTLIPATPFAITPTAPDSGVIVQLIGVWFAETGNTTQLAEASGAPTAGQYQITGAAPALEITFAAADTGKAVRIVYTYTVAASAVAGSATVPIQNAPMGATPVMKGLFVVKDVDRDFVLSLESVIPGGLKFASKIDDWTMMDLPLKAFANCAGAIGSFNVVDNEEC